jgi:hypothetical protein
MARSEGHDSRSRLRSQPSTTRAYVGPRGETPTKGQLDSFAQAGEQFEKRLHVKDRGAQCGSKQYDTSHS